MLGKQTGQMGFGDLETMGQVPEGHFLLKIDGQINWRPLEKLMATLYHPTQGRPSHPPLVMFKALFFNSGMLCPTPAWKKPSATACRSGGFWVCPLGTRCRMKTGFAGSATCRPRRTWGSACLPC